MPEVKELEADSRVYKVTGPMCRWEMKAKDKDGNEGFVRKETSFLTSSKELAEILSGKCANAPGHFVHRHVHLVGGNRAKMAAEYPIKMVVAVLKAMRRQLIVDGKISAMNAFDAGPVADEIMDYTFENPNQAEYWDDVNGGVLPLKEVEAA
jgi:hypothetical protein